MEYTFLSVTEISQANANYKLIITVSKSEGKEKKRKREGGREGDRRNGTALYQMCNYLFIYIDTYMYKQTMIGINMQMNK